MCNARRRLVSIQNGRFFLHVHCRCGNHVCMYPFLILSEKDWKKKSSNLIREKNKTYLFLQFYFPPQIMGFFVNILFLGHAFTIMLVYIWSRQNEHVLMNFFGLFNFYAPYLPWVLFGFSFILGNSILVDLLGIAVGHIYYYLETICPSRFGFRLLKTPHFL